MKTFQEFCEEIDPKDGLAGAPNDVNSSENSLLDALKIAAKKYQHQLEKFLKDLNDSEINSALNGQTSSNDAPIAPDDMEHKDEVRPHVADGSPGLSANSEEN